MKKEDYRSFLNSKFNTKIMNLINSSIHDVRMDILFNVREQQEAPTDPRKNKQYLEKIYKAVRIGDTLKIIDLIDQSESELVSFAQSTDLEECRRLVFAQAYHIAYLAIDAGVPDIKAYSMLDAYLGYIRSAETATHLVAISINFFIEFTEHIRYFSLNGKMSPEITEAVNYIEVHMHEKISIDAIANHVHLSRRQLARKFQLHFNSTIIEYINEQKMEEARYLLRLSQLGVAEIASYLAYSSESYFIHVFKNYHDCSPLEYRKANLFKV